MVARLTENIQVLKNYINELPYLYFNDAMPREGIPEFYKTASKSMKLALLCCFGVERLGSFTAD